MEVRAQQQMKDKCPKWEGNKFNQFKFCTNSHSGFYFDFKSNYCFVCRYTRRSMHAHTNDKVSGFAYAFVFLFPLIQKFHFNPTGGFVLNTREKYSKTKAKSLKPIRWLIACNSNQLNRLTHSWRKFSRKNFHWKSQFKWESMSKINQFESSECVSECVHKICIAKNHSNHSKMMNNLFGGLTFTTHQ